MSFLRFGIFGSLEGKKIGFGQIMPVLAVFFVFVNAILFQLFLSFFESENSTWREDLGAEGLVYVFDGRLLVFWSTAIVSLLLLLLYMRALAIPLLVFGVWVAFLDQFIYSNVGGQDVLREFAVSNDGSQSIILPLNIFTGLVITSGFVLAAWPNRYLIKERFDSLTGGEKLGISLLLANALSYQIYFTQMNSQDFDWRQEYGVDEALYTTEGRVIIAWSLAILGILTFIGFRGLIKWLLVFHWLWAVYLDSILQGTVGGLDVWNDFAFLDLFAAIQQLQGFIGLLIALTAIWLFTGWYRRRVIAWIDNKGSEITKDSEAFDHTSPLAIIAIVLAFIFPIGGLVLAAIAKREIALAKSNVGGVNLVVAANITSVVVLALQVLLVLSISFDPAQFFFLLDELFGE